VPDATTDKAVGALGGQWIHFASKST